MSVEIGSHIFDYEVMGVLGAGGMGKVYKVRNVISDRVEAMKILLPDLAGQPELAERFLNEIKVLASLNHPHIAALHTALRVENQLLMLMEMVEGVTLSQRLQEGTIPLPDAVRYLDQTLSALSYAHQRGVIHRDIKPANMMLTPDGNIKLMDFGIAKASSDMGLTRTGTTLGSLYYISPEQLSGAGMDARSDLYSLGVTAYQIVTGKRPFEGPSDYSLMTAHLKEMPRPPIELDSRLPQALNDVILTALAKDPAQRFQTADAFRNALGSVTPALSKSLQETAAAPLPGTRSSAQPAAKADLTSGPAEPASARPQPAGYRGLYMTLGALVAIAVIVLAATELPKWWKARASSPPAAPVSIAEPASTPATSSAPASGAAHALQETSTPAPAAPSASDSTSHPPISTALPPRGSVPIHKNSPVRATRKASSQSASAASPGTTPAIPGGSVPAATSAPASTASVASTADLQQLSDRMDQLSGRANAVKTTIQNLQQQESSAGSSLRPDVLASESRMERYMDEADSALSARNASTAKHYMELAEREINNLESFLGR